MKQIRWKAAGAAAWAAAATILVIWSSLYSLHTAAQAKANAQELRAVICPFYRAVAALPVSPKASALGRGLVRAPAEAYELLCVKDYGPLPHIDPQVYRPAPTATPSGSKFGGISVMTINGAKVWQRESAV